MFDHHSAGIARFVRRREADEQPMVAQLPVAVGDEAATFAGNLDPGGRTQTQAPRPRLQRVDAELQRHLIEITIARRFQPLTQIDGAVTALLPTVEGVRAQGELARAME